MTLCRLHAFCNLHRVTFVSPPAAEKDRSGTPGPNHRLRVHALPSPEVGFPLDHPYLELVYTPLIGPSAVLLARALGRATTASDGPVTIDLPILARDLGLRARADDPLGRTSPVRRSIERLVHTRIARWLGDDNLGVVIRVSPLSAATLDKLPRTASDAHEALVKTLGVDSDT